MVTLQQFMICLVNLDPTIGSEIKKTRPAVIISPNSMNQSRLKTIIVAPMTSTIRENFPTRINLNFKGKSGQVAIDQIRAIDKARMIKVLGHVDKIVEHNILHILSIMFQP